MPTTSLLDRLYARLSNRRLFFKEGWGDLARLRELYRGGLTAGPPPLLEVHRELLEQRPGHTLLRIRFRSPYHDLPLPEESREALCECLLPGAPPAQTPVCLHFAATGDEGYSRRRRAFALPLLAAGIGSVILENPYYGRRRPAGQQGKMLDRFSDLWAMAGAAVAEGRGLLRWLRQEGYTRLGVFGISMGASVAAQVAVLEGEPVAVIGGLTAHSASVVFTEGVLSRSLAWEVLDRELSGRERAVDLMRALLDLTDLRHFEPPRRAEAAYLVGARRDAYIPGASVKALHDHWPGSTLTWLDTGHVGAFLFHRATLLAAVRQAFRRL